MDGDEFVGSRNNEHKSRRAYECNRALSNNLRKSVMFQHFNSTDKTGHTYGAETGSSKSKDQLSIHSSQFSKEYKGNIVNFSIQFSANAEQTKAHSMNQLALLMATIFYALFGSAEVYAGYISKSLALQADSINCFVDAAAYLTSYFVEGFKLSNEGVELSYEALFVVEILIPAISTLILLGYMIYFMVEAIGVLINPATNPTVDMEIVIWFAVVNIMFNIIIIPLTLYRENESKSCTCNPDDINLSEELVMTASIEGGSSALNVSKLGLNPLSARSDNSFSAADTPSYQNFSLLPTSGKKSGESRMPSAVTDSVGDRYDYHDEGPRTSSGKFSSIYSIVSDEDNSIHVVQSKIDEKNYNMISAILHLVGDVIMATGELVAALVADFSNADADICDASAALLTCSLVSFLSIYMLYDLYEAYDRLGHVKFGVVDESINRKLLSDIESEAE